MSPTFSMPWLEAVAPYMGEASPLNTPVTVAVVVLNTYMVYKMFGKNALFGVLLFLSGFLCAGVLDQPTSAHQFAKPFVQSNQYVSEATVDDYQLTGYHKIGIHHTMINDKPRTGAYRRAMVENPELFKDKVVLDVGAGTGILSLFAAQAGAKHVYAVEYHSKLAKRINEAAKASGFGDRVTALAGRVEDVQLPVAQVDIIISEWMGYALLYESMLDSVIYARDKWLRKTGILLPNKATLYLAGSRDDTGHAERKSFWSNVYGFNMSSFQDLAIREASIAAVFPEFVVAEPVVVKTLDLETVKDKDLDFIAQFSLEPLHSGPMHTLDFWFDVEFTHGRVPVILSTDPEEPLTHWQQTHFYLTKPVHYDNDDATRIEGTLHWKRNAIRRREIDLSVDIGVNDNTKPQDHYTFAIEF